MSNHVVAVNIVRQPSPFAPQASRTRTKSFVRLEGSVADLRKALLEDQVIQPNDKFYGVNGQPLSNNSEIHTKWTEALQGILVVGAEETEGPAEPIACPTYTCIYKTQTPAQLPIQAPIVKRVEEVPPVIYSLSSASSDVSDTKTAVTEQPVVTTVKPTCTCSHQVAQAAAPPIVVVSPVETIPIINAPVETIPIINAPVQTIPVIDTPVEIVQQPTVITPVAELPVVVEPEPVVLKPEVEETATSDCPCEACQGAVTVVPEPEPVLVQEVPRTGLAYDEKTALIVKSALGYGFNISDPAGPVNTNYPVVAQLAIDNVDFDAAADSDIRENVVVTSSARETAYIRSGWTASALTVEHPWAPQSVDRETNATEALKTVSVTGQYVSSKYQVSLTPDTIRPHPEFEAAIHKALAIENAARRSEELGNVFRQYGHVYVAAVEFGGMERATITRSLREEETEDAIVEEVKSILKEAFTSKAVNDCPCPECANNVPAPSVTNDIIETIGGATDGDISLWQASLADPTTWAATRTLRVESVISLFDEVTRAKILAVVPQAVLASPSPSPITAAPNATTSFAQAEPTTKVPLHRLFSPRSGIHFYTTKSAEVDSAVRVHGYNYETLAAHILPEIDESELTDTVPLYRVHRGTKHLYTIDLSEVQGGQGHGLVGYVHATKQPGTVPLYRIFNPRTDAHLFTTNVNEKESLLKVGWADEGVTCYVYL